MTMLEPRDPSAQDFAIGDLSAPELAGPQLEAPDFASLDERLQATFQVDRITDYPEFPDEVRYDLAAAAEFRDAEDLSGFLHGLQADLRAVGLAQGGAPTRVTMADNTYDVLEAQGNYLTSVQESGGSNEQYSLSDDSFYNDIRSGYAGLAGKNRPRVFSANADKRWKSEVLRRGIVEPEEFEVGLSPVRWKAANYEMYSQQLGERLSGGRFGGVPLRGKEYEDGSRIDGITDLFDQWLSPSGLMATAVAMDFIPDPGAIARETSGWGDKWRKWWDNPTSVRDFIDAATGPIDDIVFPVLNTALLFSGVGATWQAARLGTTAYRAGRAANRFSGLVRPSPALAKAFGFGDDTIRSGMKVMEQTSVLSNKMARSGHRLMTGSAQAMDQWRTFHSVQTAKMAVRGGMRLGLAGNVETLLFPDREGGIGLFGAESGTKDMMEKAREWRVDPTTAAGSISMVAEMAFQPSRLFLPGTVTGKVTGAAKMARRWDDYKQYDVGNLVEGQVRRLDYAKGKADDHVFRAVARVADNEELARARHVAWQQRHGDATNRALDELGSDASLASGNLLSDPEEIREFGHKLKTSPGFRDHARERAGEISTFMLASAATDHAAQVRLAEMGLDRSNRIAYLKVRNSILDSITPRRAQELVDVNAAKLQKLAAESADETLDAARRTAASEELERYSQEIRVYLDERLGYRWTDNPDLEGWNMDARLARRESELEELMGGFFDPTLEGTADDPFALMKAHMTEWDSRRQTSFDSLLEQTPVENLVGYMDDMAVYDPEVFNRWDDFHDAMGLIAGEPLDRASLSMKKIADRVPTEGLIDWPEPYQTSWGTLLNDELRKVVVPADTVSETFLNTYKGADRAMLDDVGQLTVARLDTPVKQDLDSVHALTTQLRDMKRAITDNPMPQSAQDLAEQFRVFQENWMSPGKPTLKQFAKIKKLAPAEAKGMEALEWVAASGGDLDDPLGWIARMEDDLLRSDMVKRIQGLDHRQLTDVTELRTELEALRTTTAAEVAFSPTDGAAKALEAALNQKGYKLVYGQQFLSLQDVMGLRGPFAALTQARLDRMAFGRFFQKISESEKMVQRRRRFTAGLKSRFDWDDMEVEARIQALEEAVGARRERLEDVAEHEAVGFMRKTSDRVRQALSPRSIYDYNMTSGDIVSMLGVSKEEALGIHAALVQSRQLGFATNGMVEIENAMASKPWLRSGLALFDDAGLAEEAKNRHLWQKAFLGDSKVKSGWDSFYKAKLAATTTAGAAIGAGLGDDNGDWRTGAIYGALGGAGVAASPKVVEALTRHAPQKIAQAGRTFNPMSIRSLTRAAVGAGVGGLVAGGYSREDWEDKPWAIGAALFGAMATPGALRLMGRGYDSASNYKAIKTGVGFRDYSRLTERALGTRDFLRFTINPWFDAQRYSEALVMGATKKWGDDIQIPLNYSPKRTRKLIAAGKVNVDEIEFQLADAGITFDTKLKSMAPDQIERRLGQALKEATGGRLDPDLMEATTRRFTDLGVLGFSNHRWQTAAATHLMSQGVSLQDAADMVQDLYSYGKAGRSAAELSANFVFFPFSYMKKLGTQVGKFATDDLSRAIFMHDALKTYEVLDERFDLQDKFDAYMPILRELRVLNPLGMGLSPGALGGINRPMLDVAYGSFLTDPMRDVANLFLPQALTLEDPEDASNIYDLMARAVPAAVQARWLMMETLPEQTNVFTSPQHVSTQEEITRGVYELQLLRQRHDLLAQEEGFDLGEVMRTRVGGSMKRTTKAQLKDAYRAEEADLMDRYPALGEARREWAAKRYQRNAELSQITNRPNPSGLSLGETAVWMFAPRVKEFEERMDKLGIDDPDFYPREEEASIRAVAVALAAEYPGFETYYRMYWQEQFDTISMEI